MDDLAPDELTDYFEPSRDNVVLVLRDMEIPPWALGTDKTLEELLYATLAPHFESVTPQCFVDGHLGTKIGVDIARRVGVEIKLAANLARAPDVQRFLDQVLQCRQRYAAGLIVAIAGLGADDDTTLLLDMRDQLLSLGVTV